ncbi:MAG TPA: LPS export ABC transporter periplasmic protein LptC [Rectinemataceae bacterium]|nr:LPS export ABC transporter periplasmic protein LptC [Rectinemataceae bacterium]
MPRAEPRRAAALVVGAVLLLLGAATVVSCHFTYGAGAAAAGAAAAPTAVFVNYQHNVVTRGALSFHLSAERAEVYDADKKTVLHAVSFAQYDPDTGELVASGRADEAVYYSENEDAEFSGDVRLESKRQDAVLVGEYLRWDGTAKKLSGRLERTVTISRSDGSFVTGAGFEADALRRSFSFKDSVEGTLTARDEAAGAAK